ncbi:hypothetical protein SPSIL_008730 [Sporomusa silvacetica DSM 10669]|uniref:Uncharacterized protein n=1 Tax=Sporomusa silvacetica DSM 10669 TaxID=1123289 RepID=A0ABZ3IGG3_9FIRM|nr:hypothetical protein [Sporomusa silvacetica]OZC13167.1 hypothetical protein SPSIL_56230 [Sporomusa silvacetica DSM 10669]
MEQVKNLVSEDMEKLSQEDFIAKYCADEITNSCHNCEECQRDGSCCLTCKYRKQCPFTCRSEAERLKLEAIPTYEFYKKIANHDESLLTFVAAERIRNDENRIAELIEKHVQSCIACEKMDYTSMVIELKAKLSQTRQYTKLGEMVFKVFQNNLENQVNQASDCPIPNYEADCEECPFSMVCETVIEIEQQMGGTEANHDK